MATTLPPPPTNDQTGSYAWLEWFRQLRAYITITGSVPWSIINFAGSTISDIASRSHQALQALQGGTTGQYYHLTQAQHTAVGQQTAVQSVAVNTALDDTYRITSVTATGKTITLPACSTARIGQIWTVIQAVDGYVDITRSGSDTFIHTTETTIRLTTKGASVTFVCLTTSTWGIQ